MNQFAYPVTMTSDDDGGYVVTFRDLPEAITQGDTPKDCLMEAADCLDEAIAARIDDQLEIPIPSKSIKDERLVAVPMQTAMKAALYIAMIENDVSKTELASRLELDEKEARRILDPHHGTKLPKMEQALIALGKSPELHIMGHQV